MPAIALADLARRGHRGSALAVADLASRSVPRAHAHGRLLAARFAWARIVALSLSFPSEFYSEDFFRRRLRIEICPLRSGSDLRAGDARTISNRMRLSAERLKSSPAAGLQSVRAKLPHIILLHDESSFDITAAPGIKVRRAIASISGRSTASRGSLWSKAPAARAGSPNTTCSPDCRRAPTGGFATSVTRIAAGRVARGLPHCAAADAATRRSACIRSTAPFSARAISRPRPASSAIWT